MSESTDPNLQSSPSGRHGCLTTYLIFMIVVNTATTLVYLCGGQWLRKSGSTAPDWAFWAFAAAAIVSVIAAIAIFKWKRWGFWLFIVSAIAASVINVLIGLSLGIFGAVLGVALLFVVLQIGKERKAWPRLQ